MARKVRGWWLFLLGLLGLHSGSVVAERYGVICLDGIKGESQNENVLGCIDVGSWSWGHHRDFGDASGSGSTLPPSPIFTPFTFSKKIDSASDELFAAAYGNAIPVGQYKEFINSELQIGCCPVLTIEMTNIFVSSISSGGTTGSPTSTETISLEYAQIEMCISKLNPDGSIGSPECKGWDRIKNIGF